VVTHRGTSGNTDEVKKWLQTQTGQRFQRFEKKQISFISFISFISLVKQLMRLAWSRRMAAGSGLLDFNRNPKPRSRETDNDDEDSRIRKSY